MNTYVIHLKDRADRLGFVQEFEKQSFVRYKVFDAICDVEKPERGLLRSVQEIIKKEYKNKCVMICEDDIQFNSIMSYAYFQNQATHIKSITDCDFVIGGASYFYKKTKDESLGYFKLYNFSGTHLIVFYKRMYDFILAINNYTHYDSILSKACVKDALKGYAVYPFAARQANGYSTIRNVNVNDDVFFNRYKYL